MAIDKSLFESKCRDAFVRNGLDSYTNDACVEKLYHLTVRMLEVNEHMNLTAITEIDDIILKHYIDSLTVAKYIPEHSKLIDVGCGAGFPSLVLSVARPDISITALDSTSKRINYINETSSMLELDNIIGIPARAEELSNDSDYREAFDIACARAVARLNILCELCLPFVRINGCFLAMKANFESELSDSHNAISTLGGGLINVDSFGLVSDKLTDYEPRSIISIKKIRATPKNYPRNNSQIKKKPL